MLNLEIEHAIAEEVFEILQELINRAKENGDYNVIAYIAPILVKYGQAYINAKPGPKKRNRLLSKEFVRKYSRC